MSGSTSSPVITTLTVDDANLRKALADAAALITGYTRANEQASRALVQHGQATDQVSGGTRNFGVIVGQAGFQVQDFATQVSMGQNALTAFGVQFAQFAGAFGTAGAIAGAVVTVGLLASQFLSVESATEKAKREADLYATAIEKLRDLMESAAEKADRLRLNSVSAGRAAALALAEGGTQRGIDIGEQILRRQEELDANVARRATLPGNGQIALALDRTIEQQRQRIASLRGDAEMAAKEVREGMRLMREFDAQAEAPTGREKGKPTVERASGGSGRARVEAMDQATRDAMQLQNSFDNFWDRAEDRAEQRSIQALHRTQESVDEFAAMGREMGTVFTSAFDGIVTGSRSASEALKRFGEGIARIIERQFITKPLESAFSAFFKSATSGEGGEGGLFSSAGSWISSIFSSIFGGARAGGGPVDSGMTYLVGENGPELFTPSMAGAIIPNHAMGGSVINIDARGAEPGVEAKIRHVVMAMMPTISQATRGEMFADINRGGNAAVTVGRRR